MQVLDLAKRADGLRDELLDLAAQAQPLAAAQAGKQSACHAGKQPLPEETLTLQAQKGKQGWSHA